MSLAAAWCLRRVINGGRITDLWKVNPNHPAPGCSRTGSMHRSASGAKGATNARYLARSLTLSPRSNSSSAVLASLPRASSSHYAVHLEILDPVLRRCLVRQVQNTARSPHLSRNRHRGRHMGLQIGVQFGRQPLLVQGHGRRRPGPHGCMTIIFDKAMPIST